MRCASAGVRRLQVAGSLLRSYVPEEKVSYTERLVAKVSFLLGAVADRCVIVGGGLVIVESTGAEELGWLNIETGLSGGGWFVEVGVEGDEPASWLIRSGDDDDASKLRGGNDGAVFEEWEECEP